MILAFRSRSQSPVTWSNQAAELIPFPAPLENPLRVALQELEMARAELQRWNDLIWKAYMNGDRDFIPHFRHRRELAEVRMEKARERRWVVENYCS